jgi:hypothetical protein
MKRTLSDRPAQKNDNDSVLSKIVEENGVYKLYGVWQSLLKSEKSKFDSKGEAPVINKRAYIASEQYKDKTRHCWTCNKSLYSPGIKYNNKSKSLPVYHLALTSRFKTFENLMVNYRNNGNNEKEKLFERKIQRLYRRIKLLGSGNYHITHTCGHGRTEKSKDFINVCINPKHLHIRSKKYNEEQVHCHYYLHHKDEDMRKRFIDARLCNHKPKCF